MRYKENWEETKERFTLWWRGENRGRPLMKVTARRKKVIEELQKEGEFTSPEDFHLNVDERIKRYRNYCKSHVMLGEAFPNFDLNIGPGSLALYLGSEPGFSWDTVWFKECVKESWQEFGPLRYDPDNFWWKKHFSLLQRACTLADGDFLINIPDLVENVDILSAMRGPQTFCYDLIDEPEVIKDYVRQLDDLYFSYYDPIYHMVKGDDGSSSFTAFEIWGPGKTAKVQCDFNALMSPKQFREFVVPSLEKQCWELDCSMFHLDGPDAARHIDALMEISDLNALQWTPGAGRPDGGDEKWYPIYDKVRRADKSLWIALYDGGIDAWIHNADKLVKRYGTEGLYLLFPDMEEEEAEILMAKAEKDWR